MSSKTLRRRLHHGDVDGRGNEHLEASGLDGLNEPLLAEYEDDKKHTEGQTLEDIWDDEQRKQQLHWTFLFSHLITQWAQWLANIVLESGSLLGRFLPLIPASQSGSSHKRISYSLSPLQDALKQLWSLAYPDRELPALKSELWKEMGWQGSDPSTDFRLVVPLNRSSLYKPIVQVKNKTHSSGEDSFQRLLHKQDGTRAAWEYPFAVAGINISFTLIQMLDLQSGKPSSVSGIHFLELLKEDEMAFDNLYCVAFQMMDAQWLAKRASYMEFNDVLKSTRTQLERELALEDVSSVKDLPAYNLLR
ncbi:hypothetical protein EZV62_007741 [Acer yangbiense]|uniref:ELMO domain-containing protein n=1 Tax=Acer yangbiense TaxID=1000413 RepID=A0A5C7IDC0_9ROSI|nr:hypothetical protein EZV62_007741 [Acer yangbiense]